MLLRNAKPETNTEDGYLLLTVLVMVFLVLLALSVAAPRVAKEIQRDKEEERAKHGNSRHLERANSPWVAPLPGRFPAKARIIAFPARRHQSL